MELGHQKPPAAAMERGKAKAESSEEEFFSDSESGSESIEITDLRKRMWKDQLLLMKLEGRSGNAAAAAAARGSLQPPPAAAAEEAPEARYRRKAMLRAQDGVLRHMLKMMEACNARGFVYGIVDEVGVPVSGSSDSLRGWWKEDVGFDRAAPGAVSGGLVAALGIAPGPAPASFLQGLLDIQDSTLGSLLSALIQHCEPPQRSFPLDRGLPPPWWPTGREPWWGLQGEAQAHQGPPPYRKPHDLKKAWKISLLSAVIKHLSPRFDQMRKLVWQSKRLQHKMSARDADTWARVITLEEALDHQLHRSLQITPLDDDDDGAGAGGYGSDDKDHVGKRKREDGNDKDAGGAAGHGGGGEELLALPDIDGVPEVDRNSIDELMRLYYSCLQGTDSGEEEQEETMQGMAATGLAGREQSGAAGETAAASAMHEHDDMLEGLLSVADVVDMRDFPTSPICHWGSSDLD